MVRLINKLYLVGMLGLIFVGAAWALSDYNLSNNMVSVSINISSTIPIKVLFVPIENEPVEYLSAINEQIQFINRTYPISDSGVQFIISHISIKVPARLLTRDDVYGILGNLSNLASFDKVNFGIGIVNSIVSDITF